MLTLQLRERKTDGLIALMVYPQVPPKVEYSLTWPALHLVPILKSLGAWVGEHYAPLVKL